MSSTTPIADFTGALSKITIKCEFFVRIKDVKAKGSMQIYLENSIHTGFLNIIFISTPEALCWLILEMKLKKMGIPALNQLKRYDSL